jgi:iron complex outermembrane recepter protein
VKGWQFSEELRDSFNPLPGVKVLVGGFFMDDHYFQFQNFRVNFASVRQYNTQDQDNRSGSLFVQTYWDLTPKLRLQVGVRGTTEYTQMTAGLLDYLYSGPVQFTGGTLLPSTPNGPSIPPETGAKTWNNLGGKVGLDYQWTPTLMTYAYYARGFKSGGFVGRIGIPSDLGPYNPEYVDTFEVGVKSDWFDRRLRADLALFYNNYRNLQVATPRPRGPRAPSSN